MAIESSTFSPHRSGWEAFTLLRGNELVRRYPFLRDGAPLRREAEWVGILRAGAGVYEAGERVTLDTGLSQQNIANALLATDAATCVSSSATSHAR